MASQPRLVLGSGSPRRLELLAQIGVVPDVVSAADIDETPRTGERPLAYVRRMALEKSAALSLEAGDVVLTADTTVAVGLRILGKPADETEARAFLQLMSGRRHTVITAVAVRTETRSWCRDVSTSLRLRHLSETDITSYIATDEWRGKAGGYGIQGAAAAFVPWMRGSYTSVVGLPLAETSVMLRTAGIAERHGS